jgi:hypothetical protein
MTQSAINPNINERYPYPGVDNDLQGFRDNFNTIKTGLTTAKDEISDLLTNVIRKDSTEIDFNGNIVTNAVIKNTTALRYSFPELQTTNFNVDFNNGTYQTVQVGADLTITLNNFPRDTETSNKLGTLRLHLFADATSRLVQFTAGNAIIKYNVGFPFVNTNKLQITGSPTANPILLDIWQVNNGTPTPTMYIMCEGLFR